ncbi:ribonuclease-like 3 [Brachyhypopomus gauderio]|uniref:ribonuclease-like 3 n=1 Tax=Brachyhypopomus gauderio TaxID=698409 RepID=UPI0040415D81
MEIHWFVVGLMLTLSTTPWADAQSTDVTVRYKNFLRQHVNKDMDENQCNDVIRSRNITNTKQGCKEKNTFIRATESDVKAVCSNGVRIQRQGKNLYKSNQTFSLIICKLINVSPQCKYSGSRSTLKIIVECDHGLPVHYNGDIRRQVLGNLIKLERSTVTKKKCNSIVSIKKSLK